MKNKGTKITYKSLGRNSGGDNREVLKSDLLLNQNPKTEEEMKALLNDENIHFIKVTDHEIFAVKKLEFQKNKFLLIEPNPVTFYFSIAFDLAPQIEVAKQQLKDALTHDVLLSDASLAAIYSSIFRINSIAIIFSFLVIEAFTNQLLPDHIDIKFKNKSISKEKIQRWASFDDKLTTIIPNISGKDFCSDHPKKAYRIKKLLQLRNELIHLKHKRKDSLTSYNEIYQHILDVDLKAVLATVKFYINYHQSKTIINYSK